MRFNHIDKTDPLLERVLEALLVTAISQTNKVFQLRKIKHPFRTLACELYCSAKAGTLTVNGVVVPQGTGLLSAPTLAIHSTPEQFASSAAFVALVGGKVVEKAAATALTFSAAHVVTASKFGVILVQMDNAGTISTKVPASPQAYETAGAALAALPAADSGKIALGYIAIANNAGDWTGNTDDLTDGSDVTTATFNSNSALAKTVSAAAHTALTWVEATTTEQNGNKNDYLALMYTSDGSGSLTNGRVALRYRIRGGRGEI